MNNSLFPDADPSTVTWAGPPPEIVTVQSLLYASLATSLFAAFLAMLGKQWVNRYLRNHGGSVGDKSRDRQRKLDGFGKWHFYLAIEGLPVMLQIALLLLGCALSRYLWAISRTVAGVTIAFTFFGITSYLFFTLAATLYYNCPYQTPLSILTRTTIRYLTCSDAAFARSLRLAIASLPSSKNLGRNLKHFFSKVRSALKNSHCLPVVAQEAEGILVAAVVVPRTRIFEDILIDWEACKADARCISWVLHSMTDPDVILSTVWFAVDTIWYPEIAEALSPHILADLFFDCLLDGGVIPGKEEHAISIGMALTSILSIQLIIQPEDRDLRDLCKRISDDKLVLFPYSLEHQAKPTLMLIVTGLKIITRAVPRGPLPSFWQYWPIPEHLPTTHKLWLSRVILQTLWHWRCLLDPPIIPRFFSVDRSCEKLMADGGQMIVILKTNCLLIMAISLGLQIDIHDLYAPHNKCVTLPHLFPEIYSSRNSDALHTAFNHLHQQLQTSIQEGNVCPSNIVSVLKAFGHLNPFQIVDMAPAFIWMTEILNSRYSELEHYWMARTVVQLLGNHFQQRSQGHFHNIQPTEVPPLLDFLLLCEKFYATESNATESPHPGSIALYLLSAIQKYSDFSPAILPILLSTLLPTHPLQSRRLALKVFHRFMPGWFSTQMENISYKNLNRLLQAVGDPFQFLQMPTPGKLGPEWRPDDDPMNSVVVLIEFASSDLWRKHLHHSNFTSCEEVLSTEEGRKTAIHCMFRTASSLWQAFLHTPTKIITAIRCLEELQCLNTAEVVIMWAWTAGIVDMADHDGWKLIGHDTLRFYQTHGTERLATLKRHIVDATMKNEHLVFLMMHYEGSPCRMGSVKRPIPFARPPWRQLGPTDWTDLCISRFCQSRRLYHLFGYDLATWKEAVAAEGVVVEEVDEEMDVSPGHPVPLVDWACDYP